MPYQLLTNVADYDAALDAIRDFLNATGDWTLHQDMVSPDEGVAAGGHQLVASNGDCLIGLRSTDTGDGADRLFVFDGIAPYTGTPDLDSLPDNSGIRYTDAEIENASEPSARHLQQFAGPFPSLHLFSDDPSTYCHAVFEVDAGVYKHLSFGNVRKLGTWDGGGFYCATYWALDANNIDAPYSNQHAPSFENASNVVGERAWTLHYEGGGELWLSPVVGPIDTVTRQQARASLRGGFGRMFKNIAESLFSGFIPLAPILLAHLRTEDTPDTVRWVGQVPDVRMVNMKNIDPGATLTISADQWLCFPLVQKNNPATLDDNYNSGYAGLAYRKRT